MRQIHEGASAGVEALMAEITARAWQDAKFLSDLKADRQAVIARVAGEMGIDAAALPEMEFEVEPSPIGDAPFERSDETRYAGQTMNEWTCGYCASVQGHDCGNYTAYDCYTYTWWDSCATNLCPSVIFTCGAPDDPMCVPV